MKRFINNVVAAFVVAIIGVSLAVISYGTINAKECFDINKESVESNTNTRAFVCFEHDAHNEKASIESCDRCHHVYNEKGVLVDGESSEDQSCAECHAGGASTKSGDSKVLDIDLAAKYHKLCRDCHLTEKKGPVACVECHKK
ncbi:MAG: cytochrome c3 family protein [Desulfamplus sp.]|nr:cytochrome c3 family protein [Desulfamplus sp.]MBF0388688.1 cytochrome c3 family protein [Desulfamplus sp.]